VARGEPCILPTQLDDVITINGTNGTQNNNNSLSCDEEDEFLIPLDDSEFILLDNETLEFGGEIFEIIGYSNGSAVICTNFYNNNSLSCDEEDEFLIPLDDSEFILLDNETLEFGGEIFEIIGYSNGSAVICTNFYNNNSLSCDEEDEFLIPLDDSEFILLDNETLEFGGEIFEIIGYSNGSAVICTNFSQNGTFEVNVTVLSYSYPVGLTVLTYVGCSLSVIGCAVVLLTYSLFKELRTLPGKILMNLSAAILATSLFLVAVIRLFALSGKEELCHTTAIFLHWFVLSEFSWMTIMSVELARTLVRASRLRPTESDMVKRKIFLIYLLIGWGIPTIVAGLSVVLNYTTDYIQYGEDGFCWIGDRNSFFAVFLTPVVLSLLLNAAAFFVTSYLLLKAQRGEAKLQKQHSTSYFRIHLSVFSVTGLTWAFGFVAILARNDWAWYIFLILTSTQGFTICAAFLFTKKVFSLYKERCWSRISSRFSLKSTLKQSTQDTSLAVRYVKKGENTSSVSAVSMKETEIGPAVEPSETNGQAKQEPVRYARDVKKQEEEIAKDTEQISVTSEREQINQEPVRYARDVKKQEEEIAKDTEQISVTSEREQTNQEPVRYARNVKKQEEEIAKDTEQISVTSEREQINQEPVRYARDVKKQEEEIAKDTGQMSVTSEREQTNQEPVRYARNVKKQEEEIAKDTGQMSVTSEREQTNQDPVRYAKKQDEERKTE
jgi:hypothetical protein